VERPGRRLNAGSVDTAGIAMLEQHPMSATAATTPSFFRDRVALPFRRWRRSVARLWRRLIGKSRPVEEANLLPLLIEVLAGFSKFDGQVIEAELDSALGLLRHEYPEAVYSELRAKFRDALGQHQNLSAMAERLARELAPEKKVMLGVQLYDLISRAGINDEQLKAFYGFTEKLGIAAQAIEIVHLLSAGEKADRALFQSSEMPLEVLTFGHDAQCDVTLKSLHPGERMLAFRYHELILLKNTTTKPVFVRGRPLGPGAFCRIFAGQRLVLDEQVLTFQDIAYYFNAKKGVFVTQVYVELNDRNEAELSRVRTRESVLEVRFGLKVQVRALTDIEAKLNGVRLRQGTLLNATLEDRIVFHQDAELTLSDLRRRARALGVRFQLKSHKSVYLVSNTPNLLETDDILLSPGTAGEVLLKIHCDYENRVGKVEVVASDRPIIVADKIVTAGGTLDLKDNDFIRIDSGQGLRCDFSERIIEEERNIVSQLELRDLTCHFGGNVTALDSLSFTLTRGDIVCVMGGSGSGKSTLLRAIAGRLPPSVGQVLLNGQPLYANLDELKRFIAFIPQDDAFDDHLTVEENLRYAAAIRSGHLSHKDRERRVDSRLIELGLAERRDVVVGSADKKTLSGGERKRLNIGLDMISSADIFLFDEPTSGLSSKDSEHVIEIIRGLAHNKIVLVVIHQPSARLFQMFTKAILLDRGGKLVFHGKPTEMLEYFARTAVEEKALTLDAVKAASGSPEFCFDIMETPLHDLSGDEILEEAGNGQLIPARRFSPDFWRDRFETHRLTLEMRTLAARRAKGETPSMIARPPQMSTISFVGPASSITVPVPRPGATSTTAAPRRLPSARHKLRWREEWLQFHTLLRRAFLSKLRNIASLFVTLLAPPVLAAVVAWALYFTDGTDRLYTFAAAFHIPTYIFIALLVALFLALMNSVEDIIRDRTVLQRERNLGVRMSYYVLAKFLTLCVFSALQCALFVVTGNAILEVRGMFFEYFLWTFLTAVSGISLGLLVSALVPNSKTGAMLVPLILIPQLIFGGALIKYEEMNRDPALLHVFQRWFESEKKSTDMEGDRKLRVPLISRFIATHYSYEALVAAQAKLNPLAIRQQQLSDMMAALAAKEQRTPVEEERLEDLKDTLAQLSGLEVGSAREVDRRLERVDEIIAGALLARGDFRTKSKGVTAAELYDNQKISDMVSKAEAEQEDYRRNTKINAFFSPNKHHFYFTKPDGTQTKGWTVTVWLRNSMILLSSSFALLAVLHFVLRRQLKRTAK
jgi:ABC transport system ATP-binding/permease protein